MLTSRSCTQLLQLRHVAVPGRYRSRPLPACYARTSRLLQCWPLPLAARQSQAPTLQRLPLPLLQVRISCVNAERCSVTVACEEALSRVSTRASSLPWPLFPYLAAMVQVQAHMGLEQSSSFAALRLLGLPEPYSVQVQLKGKDYDSSAPLGKHTM